MRRPEARRVVVTGMGCVTPLAHGLEATWAAAAAGRSGVAPISLFDTSGFTVQVAAEVKGAPKPGDLPHKEVRRMDRSVLLALEAAGEAVQHAGLLVSDEDPERIGVAIGSGIGGLGTLLHNHRVLLESGPRRVSPFTIPMSIANMPGGCVSIQHGLRGPILCHVSACASSAHALGESARTIARGDADVMLAGGAEAAITDLGIAGFAAMRALSTRKDAAASRPFDRGRDGFVVGEGAGVLVLESLEHARSRSAPLRAEILGYAATGDASHVAAPQESGEGIIRCMRLAIEDAGIGAGDIDHVNAHATGTPAGDPIEAGALRQILGARADEVPTSATKSMTGHLLGAAGALEAILSIQAIETGLVPPTINLDRPDPECELDHVANQARSAQVQIALSNSFGFGGSNASLIIAALDA